MNDWRLLEDTCPECGEVTLHGNQHDQRVCASDYCSYRTNNDTDSQK